MSRGAGSATAWRRRVTTTTGMSAGAGIGLQALEQRRPPTCRGGGGRGGSGPGGADGPARAPRLPDIAASSSTLPSGPGPARPGPGWPDCPRCAGPAAWPRARRRRPAAARVDAPGPSGAVGRGEVDGERRAVAEPSSARRCAPHPLDQVLRQGEPDAGALHAAGLGTEPVEGLEHAVDVLGPDPGAGVGRRRSGPGRGRDGLDGRRPRARPVRLYFTAFESRLSRTWRRRWRSARTWNVVGTRLEVGHDGDVPVARPAAGPGRRRRRGRLADGTGSSREIEVARLDAGDVEDLVDQVQQVPARPQDVADGLTVLVGQVVHLEQLGEARARELSGVRSSWLIRDRNSLLARLACSATSTATCISASNSSSSVTSRDTTTAPTAGRRPPRSPGPGSRA